VVPDPTRSLAEGAVELCLWLQRAGWGLTPWGRGPAVPMAPACGAGG
jgi:hypothetical protein